MLADHATEIIKLAPGGEETGRRGVLRRVLEGGIIHEQVLVVIADDHNGVRQIGLLVVEE